MLRRDLLSININTSSMTIPVAVNTVSRLLMMDSMLYFFTTHCALRLIVRFKLDVPTFATRRLHACHHARAPSGGKWNCGREMSGKFCLNADFHVTFRDLLHAIKLKIRRLRPGLNLGTKGQHATSRRQKPQVSHIKKASWYVNLINYCGTFNRYPILL